MEAFINEERTWEQLVEQVKKFHMLSQEIPTSFDPKTLIGIFDIHCDELIRDLATRAAELRDKFLEKMIHELHVQLKEYELNGHSWLLFTICLPLTFLFVHLVSLTSMSR
jgi:hypothetical protein